MPYSLRVFLTVWSKIIWPKAAEPFGTLAGDDDRTRAGRDGGRRELHYTDDCS